MPVDARPHPLCRSQLKPHLPAHPVSRADFTAIAARLGNAVSLDADGPNQVTSAIFLAAGPRLCRPVAAGQVTQTASFGFFSRPPSGTEVPTGRLYALRNAADGHFAWMVTNSTIGTASSMVAARTAEKVAWLAIAGISTTMVVRPPLRCPDRAPSRAVAAEILRCVLPCADRSIRSVSLPHHLDGAGCLPA